jgi:hypothetical protein
MGSFEERLVIATSLEHEGSTYVRRFRGPHPPRPKFKSGEEKVEEDTDDELSDFYRVIFVGLDWLYRGGATPFLVLPD